MSEEEEVPNNIIEEQDEKEEEAVKHITFGITKGNTYSFGTATANAVFRINTREEIITTSREIIRVDSGIIVNRAPHKSCTGVYCPIYDALVTITTVRSSFNVFLLNYDIREPVLSDISLDQIGICHVLFDERNSTIVTFGNGIKTWYLDCLPKSARRTILDNYANIRPRASFAQYYTAFMMVIPCLDTYNHRIFVPSQDGLLCYDYDGKFLPSPLQHNNHWFTMFTFNPYNKKMLTSDRDEAKESKAARAAQFKKQIVTQGVQYWREDGSLSKELTFTNSSLFAAFFIDKEFAITVDSAFYIHIVDMKTMKFFTCCQIECRPNHIFFQNDEKNMNLVICSASNVIYYKICIPWRLWLLTHIPPTKIERCPRFGSAARIAVQFIDSSVRLFTPYSILLTLCHSASPASPTSVVVDRGIPEENDRDQVYVVLENGVVQTFSANECPCLPASTMKLKAHSCCIAEVFEQRCILFGTKAGDILMYDYETMKFVKRIICCEGVILFLFYHPQSMSLFALTDYKMFRVSTITGKVTDSYYQKCHKCAALFEDLLIVGYENGSYLIERIHDDEGAVFPLHKSSHPLHSGRVVGLSKGSSYFVSAGFDGTVLVWDMHATVLAMLSFPSPVYSVGVHNGLRGLLVGTDTEIMFIDGNLLFDGIVDEEDVPFDNFDKRRDYLLCSNKGHEDEEEEDFNIDENGNPSNRRRRRRKKKGSGGGDGEYDLDVGPGKTHGRGRKSKYAAMMERMKAQKEKEEQEKKAKQEEEEAAEAQAQQQEEEEEVQEEIEEDEEVGTKRFRRKVRRKNNKGEYDEEYEYVDEKGNPIPNQNNKNNNDNEDDAKKKKMNKNGDDEEEVDYTMAKKGPQIVAGKEKVIVENKLEGKPIEIDEELKKRIYAEEDEKEEKAKKKKKEEAEKKKKAEKEAEEAKKGKKKGKGKRGKNGENNEDGEEDEDDDDEGDGNGEGDEGSGGQKSKKGKSDSKKAKEGKNGENNEEGNEDDEEGENDGENSPNKKSPKKPTRPSAAEVQKKNPRNNKFRQNYNDPNANPKFNKELANQLIDGEAIDEADNGNGENGQIGESGGKSDKKKKGGKSGKGKGKGETKKGKKGKNADAAAAGGGKSPGRAGLDANGNRIKDPKYGDAANGGSGGGYGPGGSPAAGRNNANTQGSIGPGGYGGNGPNGQGGYNGGPNGQGGYNGGPGGYNGGPGGYNGGPGGYNGGPNGQGGYNGGPGGYNGGPNGQGGYNGGPNGQGGYNGGPGGYNGGPNGQGGYNGGPGGYNGGPNGQGGNYGGPGGYNGQGGYNGGPNGQGDYNGGPGGNYRGPDGQGGYYRGPNGEGGYNGGPGGPNGQGNYGGPGGYNGQGGYNGGPNGQGGFYGGPDGQGGYYGGPDGQGGYYGGPNGQGGPDGQGGYNGGPGNFGPNGQSGYNGGPNGYNGNYNGPGEPHGSGGPSGYSQNGNKCNRSTSPLGEPSSASPRRRHRRVKQPNGDYEYSDTPSDPGRLTTRRPNSSSSSLSSDTIKKRRQRIRELERKRSQTPTGDRLYRLHHIIHVHLKVNREFPPDIDITKAVNPPCLVYSPEYLALALGDDDENESRWDKFKRMCFMSGVNDFAHESFRRQKHFMLTNSYRIQKSARSNYTQTDPSKTLPVAQVFQTERDPLKDLANDLENGQTHSLNSSNLPALNLHTCDTFNSERNEQSFGVNFDVKADMMRQSNWSSRTNRSTASLYTASPRLESPRSIFPWLNDEMLRPSSARKPKTQVRIINPAGKQAYRNLCSIFKKVKRH